MLKDRDLKLMVQQNLLCLKQGAPTLSKQDYLWYQIQHINNKVLL